MALLAEFGNGMVPELKKGNLEKITNSDFTVFGELNT